MRRQRTMDEGTFPKLSLRAGLARVRAAVVFGILGGTALFLIEWIDRLAALAQSFDGAGEVLRFVALLSATILLGGAIGLGLGCAGVALEALRQIVARGTARVRPKLGHRALFLSSLAAAAIVAAIALKLLSGRVFYDAEAVVKESFEALGTIVPIIGKRWKLFYVASIAALLVTLLVAHLWTFAPQGERSRRRALAASVLCAAVVILAYRFDAGESFGHNEKGLHYPLVIAYGIIAVIGAGLAIRAAAPMDWVEAASPESKRRARRALVFTAIASIAGLAGLGFGYARMDANQNVKALFWNRSVVARRVFEVARSLTDRDHDGYSPRFGGGDCDDHNARVSPSALEIPGNGADDNCLAGDLPKDAPVRRAPAPGELMPAPGPAPTWSPTSGPPPGAHDVASAAARGAPAELEPTDEHKKHVIILSIDAVRGDHTTMGGYSRKTTPRIAAYAEHGLVFTRAIAQGTNTGHSFVSLLRSSYMEAMFDRNVPTLTQLLKGAGYHTASVNARRYDDWIRQRRWHLYRPTLIEDFDVLHLGGGKAWNAAELTDQIIKYVDKLPVGRPQLLWVHYNDVHNPRVNHPERGFGKREIDVYDNAIAYTDEHVGRLLDHLKGKGILDRSIVFLMADHGEGFLEHGTVDHGNKPYQDNSHVPLVVLAKGLTPAVIDTPVGLVDVAPTALAFVGVPVPPVYRGTDLVAAAMKPAFPRRVMVSETPRNVPGSPFYAIAWIDWPFKYMYDPRATTSELYDLSSDPGEVHNLVERDRERASKMRRTLGRWIDLETARRPSKAPPPAASGAPSAPPSGAPSAVPSALPSGVPSGVPSEAPSAPPSEAPDAAPSDSPH